MRISVRGEADRLTCRRLIRAMIARDNAKSTWAKEYWGKVTAELRAKLN
jgi:hypothetical protein